jgi:hypothetical protein
MEYHVLHQWREGLPDLQPWNLILKLVGVPALRPFVQILELLQ